VAARGRSTKDWVKPPTNSREAIRMNWNTILSRQGFPRGSGDPRS
jgi:hypothetical protein